MPIWQLCELLKYEHHGLHLELVLAKFKNDFGYINCAQAFDSIFVFVEAESIAE